MSVKYRVTAGTDLFHASTAALSVAATAREAKLPLCHEGRFWVFFTLGKLNYFLLSTVSQEALLVTYFFLLPESRILSSHGQSRTS